MGLLVVSDAAREAIARNRAPQRVNGYAVASKPALTLPPDMLTRYAAGLLVRFQVSRSVVVDRDRNPIGFVSPQGLVISRQPPRPGPTVAARNTLASMRFGGGGTDSWSGPERRGGPDTLGDPASNAPHGLHTRRVWDIVIIEGGNQVGLRAG